MTASAAEIAEVPSRATSAMLNLQNFKVRLPYTGLVIPRNAELVDGAAAFLTSESARVHHGLDIGADVAEDVDRDE